MERSNSYPNKLQSFVSIGLASTALILCSEQIDASNNQPVIVTAPKTISYADTLTVVPIHDMTSLENDWNSALINHVGEVDIAVYDFDSQRTAHVHYPKQSDGATFDTASIVKLSVLEKLLQQSQTSDQPIAAYQKVLAENMIENSDNNATAVLWSEIGDAPAMDTYWQHQLGTKSTQAGGGGFWGNTQTTALDQLKVVNAIAHAGTPRSPLSKESGTIANELLQNVEPDQHWGVSGGVPVDMPVRLKNGWFPDAYTANSFSDTSSWTVNSIGYVPGEYAIAVLTRGNPTMEEGIKTAESLSTITWTHLRDTPLAPNPSKP